MTMLCVVNKVLSHVRSNFLLLYDMWQKPKRCLVLLDSSKINSTWNFLCALCPILLAEQAYSQGELV